MITGLHAILYSPDAEKVRAFLRDVLDLKSVDAGHGWLIFAAPPAELAAHPVEDGEKPRHELYFMCDDLKATIEELHAKGVQCDNATEAPWGLATTIHLPDGCELGLYQPKHPTALNLNEQAGNLVTTQTVLIRIARELLLPLLILAAFGMMAGLAPRSSSARPPFVVERESPVAIEQDPHFRLLLENSQVRVFALTLPPNSQSFVRYEHNNLTIAPDEGEVIMWKEGESPVQHFRVHRGQIQFFLGQSARGFRNDARSGDYRNVTVEFLGAGVTTYGYRYYSGKWDYGPSILNPPVEPEGHFVNSLALGRAVASDVQLLPREFLPASKRLQLVVAVSPLDLQMGKRKLRLEPGEVLWLEGRDADLVNASNDPARFTVVELKAANEQY